MEFPVGTGAVEPLRQEVRSWALLKKPALHHLDSSRFRHGRVGELDAPEAKRIGELSVAAFVDPVELEQPVLETDG